MRYPDEVLLLYPTDVDEYGNPGAAWDDPEKVPAKAFIAFAAQDGRIVGKAYFPPDTDLREGGRLRLGETTYAIETPRPVRSPSKTILRTAALVPLAT